MTDVQPHSQLDKLIHMANQIAGAFATMPDAQAVKETADHLRAFWTPKMRRMIAEYEAAEGTRLDARARAAVRAMANVQNTAA
jgi:formate dehydrogenase subunit delta